MGDFVSPARFSRAIADLSEAGVDFSEHADSSGLAAAISKVAATWVIIVVSLRSLLRLYRCGLAAELKALALALWLSVLALTLLLGVLALAHSFSVLELAFSLGVLALALSFGC